MFQLPAKLPVALAGRPVGIHAGFEFPHVLLWEEALGDPDADVDTNLFGKTIRKPEHDIHGEIVAYGPLLALPCYLRDRDIVDSSGAGDVLVAVTEATLARDPGAITEDRFTLPDGTQPECMKVTTRAGFQMIRLSRRGSVD